MTWLSGWNYRKSKTISGSTGGAQTDYSIKFNVYKSTGSDAGDTVYLGTNVNNDFSDIRFTLSDEVTPLSYWIESYVSGTSAVVWVKIPNIPASPSSTSIYIYYGNVCATSSSNGFKTFDLFDDFNASTLNSQWTAHQEYGSGSSYSISSGKLRMTTGTGAYARYHIEQATAISTPTNFDMVGEIAVHSTPSSLQQMGIGISGITESWGDSFALLMFLGSPETLRLWQGNGTGTDYVSTPSLPSPVPIKFRITKLGNVWTYYTDNGTGWVQQGQTTASSWTYTTMKYMTITSNDATASSNYIEFDTIRVRKYISPEPGYGAWGIEELAPTISWLSGWTRRKLKTINGTTTPQSNYQMKFTIYKTTGSDAVDTVYCGTNVNNDFSDIRFTSQDGTTLLDYWIESYTSGVSAIVWVEIPSIPQSPDSTSIYFYYNNSSATTTSNGNNTFAFFEDFSGTSLDTSKFKKVGTATLTFSNGEMTAVGTLGTAKLIAITAPTTDYYIARARFKATGGTDVEGRVGLGIKTNTTDNFGYGYFFRDFSNMDERSFLDEYGAGWNVRAGSWLKNTWYIEEIYHDGTNVKGRFNDGTWQSQAWSGRVGYPDLTTSYNSVTTVWDWALVRKYASPEPGYGAWCIEETYTVSCPPPSCNLVILLEQLLSRPPGHMDLEKIWNNC